jgi:hypothetical protein
MSDKLLVPFMLVVIPIQTWAQTSRPPAISKATRATAAAELEAVIADAANLDDVLAIVTVKARAAGIISLSDPIQSELMFRELWRFVKERPDTDLDKDRARSLILRSIFPRNPALAKQLLNGEKKEEVTLESRAAGHDPDQSRTAKLAAELVDEDPREASELLEASLTKGMTVAGLSALKRLRQKDPLLSDFIAGKILEGLRIQPEVIALHGFHLLSDYLYPEGPASEPTQSLQSLRTRYFLTTYELLRQSMVVSEASLIKDQHYTQGSIKLRAAYQGLLAQTLAALAPQFRPDLAPELSAIANSLGARIPVNIAPLSKLNAARLRGEQTVPDQPDLTISLAIQSGDFEEATRLIDELKSDEAKKTYSQMLLKIEVKSLLSKSDVAGALTRIRKVEDHSARLVLYLEAVKTAQRKDDPALSRSVINEARTLIPQVGRNGLHVRILLSFAALRHVLSSLDEAIDFLDAAVLAINALPRLSEQSAGPAASVELAWKELNDPSSLLVSTELGQAFAAIGGLDFERAIIEGRKIVPKPVQLIARLEAAGEILKIDARKVKTQPQAKRAAAGQ